VGLVWTGEMRHPRTLLCEWPRSTLGTLSMPFCLGGLVMKLARAGKPSGWCGQALSPCRAGVGDFTTCGGLQSLTPWPNPSALLACDAPPHVPYQFPLHLHYWNTLLKLPRPPSPAKDPNSYSHVHLAWAFLLVCSGRWVASKWEKGGDPLYDNAVLVTLIPYS